VVEAGTAGEDGGQGRRYIAAGLSAVRVMVTGVLFAALWCPWTAGRTFEDVEPFGSSLLFAAAAVQAWSQWRLWRGGAGSAAA